MINPLGTKCLSSVLGLARGNRFRRRYGREFPETFRMEEPVQEVDFQHGPDLEVRVVEDKPEDTEETSRSVSIHMASRLVISRSKHGRGCE